MWGSWGSSASPPSNVMWSAIPEMGGDHWSPPILGIADINKALNFVSLFSAHYIPSCKSFFSPPPSSPSTMHDYLLHFTTSLKPSTGPTQPAAPPLNMRFGTLVCLPKILCLVQKPSDGSQHYLEPGILMQRAWAWARRVMVSGSGQVAEGWWKVPVSLFLVLQRVPHRSATDRGCLAWCGHQLICHSHPPDPTYINFIS